MCAATNRENDDDDDDDWHATGPLPVSPSWGAGGGPFSPVCADYDDERTHMAALWLPIMGGLEGGLVPGNAPIMPTTMARPCML